MKRSCKKSIVCLLSLLLIVSTTSSIFAVEETNLKTVEVVKVTSNDKFMASNNLSDIGPVSYKTAISIEGEKINLYPTFDNLQSALDNIKANCNELLNNMAQVYELEPFSLRTVQLYYDRISEYENTIYEQYENSEVDNELFKSIKDSFPKMYSFFDIYENDRANLEILSSINVTGTTMVVQKLSLQNLNELKQLLPSNTGGTEKIEEIEIRELGQVSTPMSYSGNSKFTVADGVTYAVKYAASPNIVNYATKSADCTNFTSQIKKAGGVPVYKTAYDEDGWNYKNTYNGSGFLHTAYSARWVNAHKFVNFFGKKTVYKTENYDNKRTAFINFAKNIKKGSFIAYDEEGDGNWNHNAFVTYLWHSGESARRDISYHGSSYKDFKIAQHSRNYHKWVSENGDSGCGWEDLPYDYPKVTFAIVN